MREIERKEYLLAVVRPNAVSSVIVVTLKWLPIHMQEKAGNEVCLYVISFFKIHHIVFL